MEHVSVTMFHKIFNFHVNSIINMINASDTAEYFFEKETKLYLNHFNNYLHNNAAWTSNS